MCQQGSARTLLCVDDYEIALKVRQRVLEKAGYKVLIAASADEALELLLDNPVDLVLTEHFAPTVPDGPTLAARMKMLKPDVTVAILSADMKPSPEDVRFADAFITKLAP